MRPRPVRRRLGEAPPERALPPPPAGKPPSQASKGGPVGQAPRPRVRRAPRQRALGKLPNPRKPALVRDVRGGALKDLFEIFPDLPRPPRPAGRLRRRVVKKRGRP